MISDWRSYLVLLAACVIFYVIGRRTGKIEKIPSTTNFVLVDTSSLIDGRILEVAKTGFISGNLLIPKFILKELQNIADSSDPLRRAKGRRGLKITKELSKFPYFNLEIIEDDPEAKDIDEKLVILAKEKGAKIMTVDYNLNEVAKIQNIAVLNINELSNAIKPVLLPGEQTKVKIVQKGKEKDQGVGYLEDGTMIVVEGGQRFIGQTVLCEVSRIFQTEAGRIIFVKPKQKPPLISRGIRRIFAKPYVFRGRPKR